MKTSGASIYAGARTSRWCNELFAVCIYKCRYMYVCMYVCIFTYIVVVVHIQVMNGAPVIKILLLYYYIIIDILETQMFMHVIKMGA